MLHGGIPIGIDDDPKPATVKQLIVFILLMFWM